MDLSTIISPVSADFAMVDQKIKAQLVSDIPLVSEIINYITANQGKRIRPLIALLCAKSCDYQQSEHIDIAAIIEILHTATLLHDDVIDVSDLRRGHATVNRLWGNSGGILGGDFLYTRAFRLMINLKNWEILDLISKTAQTIAEGEFLQLMHCRDLMTSEADYLKIIAFKTASLFQSAAKAGAIIAEKDQNGRTTLSNFGLHFGIAFQLMDDVLDYQGDVDLMGKNIGEDFLEGKPTLPLLYTAQNCSKNQQDIIKKSIKNKELRNLPTILEWVRNSGGIDYTLNLAKQHEASAIDALSLLPDTLFKQALQQLTQFITQRNH